MYSSLAAQSGCGIHRNNQRRSAARRALREDFRCDLHFSAAKAVVDLAADEPLACPYAIRRPIIGGRLLLRFLLWLILRRGGGSVGFGADRFRGRPLV